MPPRRKPTSTNQKKADQKLKRAVKRGDVPPPDSKKSSQHRRPRPARIGPTGQIIGSAANASNVQSSRRLQSSFIKLPPHFLEETKHLASTLGLPRPIPQEVAIFIDRSDDGDETKSDHLSCPKRPKWRFDMTKTEVEKNEEGVFKKWLSQTDALVEQWQRLKSEEEGESDSNSDTDQDPYQKQKRPPNMPRSPTYFERNIEVWRQLWRVTEISQIILVLLDSRCPLLHYPPSLAAYLAAQKVILVLTKVDISGPERANAWTEYFRAHYPGLRVVQVESYIVKEERSGHQGRKMYEPHLPEIFRERLIDAVREVHEEMLEPPERVKEKAERLEKWKPPVKQVVDWEGVLKASGGKVGSIVGGAAAPKYKEDEDEDASELQIEDQGPEFLTIGLIGQPNVGKSSLLNALFGARKVRASKTPGKTKHFQTLFWTPDVRLVDCPGLVMPNFVPMEMQVLSGILPISRVSAIPSCIHHACQYLPVEQIYKLTQPALHDPPVEDKRTWRNGVRPGGGGHKEALWTAMDVLAAYATLKGWLTAKAGRPDIHRAGNYILRSLAEGKIAWAFWPPETDLKQLKVEGEDQAGTGIWIPQVDVVDDESEYESEEEEEEAASTDGKEEDEAEAEVPIEGEVKISGLGRFGALTMDGLDENEDEWEEENER